MPKDIQNPLFGHVPNLTILFVGDSSPILMRNYSQIVWNIFSLDFRLIFLRSRVIAKLPLSSRVYVTLKNPLNPQANHLADFL